MGCLAFALIIGLSGCFLTNETPIAAFWFAPELPNTGESVQFIGTNSIDPDAVSGTGIEIYEWNFGDGGSAAGETVSHHYTSAGTYSVTLTVSDSEGSAGTVTKNITISATIANPPTANFEYSPSPPAIGETVTFNAESSYDPTAIRIAPKAIATYDWNFGDGSTGSGSIVSHVYAQAGPFVVVLTVRDDSGANDTMQRTLVVVEPSGGGSVGQPPVARFSISPPLPEEEEVVTFSAETSYDPSAVRAKAITVYHWNFGDDSSATGETVTHAFSEAGTYMIVLTVTDNSGSQDTEQKSLTVTESGGPVIPPPPPPPG